MQILTIDNFGPIKNLKIKLSKVNVLIGPQASGKSSVAKLLFFMKMLPEWLVYFTPDNNTPALYQFTKFLRSKFLELFGPVSHQSDLYIKYEFNTRDDNSLSYIEIKQKCVNENNRKYIDIIFDRQLLKSLKEFFANVLNTDSVGMNIGVISGRSQNLYYNKLMQKVTERAKFIFDGDTYPIYIPAGRSLLALLSGQINSSVKLGDFIMEDFIQHINRIRPQVGQGLDVFADIAEQTWPDRPNMEDAAFAAEEIGKILRGKYAYINGEERIQHGDTYTKLEMASSGQQESLWVVLLAYMLILEKAGVFAIFEEPEAHLYPEAQYAMTKLLALLANVNPRNQILITTHSPYIMVALNNLLAAGCAGEHGDKVDKIIKRCFWLSKDDITALALNREGNSADIMSDDLCMIKAEAIDSASFLMNEDYEKIMEISDVE